MTAGLAIRGRRAESYWRPASEVAAEAIAEIELLHEHPDAVGLRTGIGSFDDKVRLALEPGRLIVVAGRSGGGKTALLAQLTVAFAAQVPTLLVTLEDDERDVVKRSMSSMSRENVSAIRSGFARSESIPDSVYSAAEALGGLQLDYSDDAGTPTVEELAIIVMAWRRTHPDAAHAVVVIDQLSHIRPSDPRDEFWDRFPQYPKPPSPREPEHKLLEWQVSMLRQLAVKHQLTVVLAHQLNDNVSDTERPTQKSIRGSRGVTHKADLVVCPWIPSRIENPFAGPGDPKFLPNDAGTAELVSVKSRSVDGFSLPVRWIGTQQRFVGIDEDVAVSWSPVPAPTPVQLEGARKLRELRARFALEALQRRALPTVPALDALPAGDEVES